MPKLTSGYAHELESGDWNAAPDEEWGTAMVVPSETERATHVGGRFIDGTVCNVFLTPDGRFYAQTKR